MRQKNAGKNIIFTQTKFGKARINSSCV